MTDRELWSFVTKYRQLLSAGKTAKLVMESHLGCARVNLEVFLNPANHPQEQQHHHRHQARVHRRAAGGLARVRRRDRRAQDRQAAAAAAEVPSRPPPDVSPVDAAVQDTGPAVAAVLHPPSHLSGQSHQHTTHSQPLDPAEEAVPRRQHPNQAEEVLPSSLATTQVELKYYQQA